MDTTLPTPQVSYSTIAYVDDFAILTDTIHHIQPKNSLPLPSGPTWIWASPNMQLLDAPIKPPSPLGATPFITRMSIRECTKGVLI
jgi:hypothetical protein